MDFPAFVMEGWGLLLRVYQGALGEIGVATVLVYPSRHNIMAPILRVADSHSWAGALVRSTFVLADAIGGRTGAVTFGGRDAGHAASDGYGAAAAGAFIVIRIRSGACTDTRTSIISMICPTTII